MTYCPQCGHEVLADDVHVCYHCTESLTEMAPGSWTDATADIDVGKEEFAAGITGLLDKEIASMTSSVTPDSRPGEADTHVEAMELRRQVNFVRFHAAGYGKGLMQMMMLEAEKANPEFSYESETKSEVYQWVRKTVDERREYIRAALQTGGEDEP